MVRNVRPLKQKVLGAKTLAAIKFEIQLMTALNQQRYLESS